MTVTNIATSPVSLTSIGFTGRDRGDLAETNNCGDIAPVGASCTISVTFTPSVTGSLKTSMTVEDTTPGTPQKVGACGTGE